MKNKEDFVVKRGNDNFTFEDVLNKYNEIKEEINDKQSEKDGYEKLKDEEVNESSSELSFKEQLEIYELINGTIKYDDPKKFGIDLRTLRGRVNWVFGRVYDYYGTLDELNDAKNRKNYLLEEVITFDNFSNGDNECFKHFLVKTDDELICADCGATTKDYDLTKEELKFLMECAERQGLILKDAKKEDIPLIKVLIEEDNFSKMLRIREYQENNEDYLTNAEEEWLTEGSQMTVMNVNVRNAHRLDIGDFFREELCQRLHRRYISEAKAKRLLDEVEKELENVKKMDSLWFKDLMIEECKVAKYEILLLAGRHIPTLYEDAETEEEKIAFIKAYYNLSNRNIRSYSNYFNTKDDVYNFDCLTADSDINNKILEMKVRR